MGTVPFDTLKLAKALEGGGSSAMQASAAVEALANAASGAELATKSDLQIGTDRLESNLQIATNRLERRIDRMEQLIQLSEQKIVIRLGGMIVIAVGVMIGAVRFLVH